MSPWEHFEHAADVGVRGIGKTPAEAFEQAALGLFSLVSEDLDSVCPAQAESLAIEAGTLEDLFFEYLSELISLADAKRMVFGKVELLIVEESGVWQLTGKAMGEPYDPKKHESTVEPKGATYTALKVAQESGRWIAQCIVDV